MERAVILREGRGQCPSYHYHELPWPPCHAFVVVSAVMWVPAFAPEVVEVLQALEGGGHSRGLCSDLSQSAGVKCVEPAANKPKE